MIALYRITAPHFVAGLLARGDLIVECAPILRWAQGWQARALRDYCGRKGWEWEVVQP